MNELPKDKKIILFDGVCNLCNSSVQFIIKKDKKDVFRFVALQSELGQKITTHIGVNSSNIDSFLLYEPGNAYYNKAEAALKISSTLGGLYSLLSIFNYFPKQISNYIYDYVARNRYKWYGKKESCMIPTPEIKSKFLE
ncbi:thiol-disulfide oxidoreductase DCC family protein [Flavobacterium capsici]|uniref:DCC1-like thiol-disulfide oxidoreductase family protein n=1 Tax=Flavobacterium capsici TaxID=3075618 RepID=A0AA96J5N0_9FLAO|nr:MULTISPECIES: DCC1-like thiol-disulfide oxidoreductase family protein [unclassified Flavobacterium]WNM20407.1 DCC1-like thiol-disulfide oxidoreductase family protein [Flavobacterium sp. PMR2A8]WNM23172.1 DCC1-like thiol-disulfide oxidoreductase family protein [Flavobacterium sp. PMTSA4]